MAITNGPKLGLMVNGLQGEEHYLPLMKLLRGLDTLIQPTVITHLRNQPSFEPPPLDGDTFIVASGGLGDWFGHDGDIARYSTVLNAWEFYAPRRGWIAYSEEAQTHLKYQGSALGWVSLATGLPVFVGKWLQAYGNAEIDTGNKQLAYLFSLEGTNGGLVHSSGKAGGKRYFEVLVEFGLDVAEPNFIVGFTSLEGTIGSYSAELPFSAFSTIPPFHEYYGGFYRGNSQVYSSNAGLISSDPAVAGTLVTNDTIGFAIDLDADKFWYRINGTGTWYGGGDPALGTGGFSTGALIFDAAVPFVATINPASVDVRIRTTAEQITAAIPTDFFPWDS